MLTFSLGLVALTSLAAGLAAPRLLGIRLSRPAIAIRNVLECLGLALVFYAINLAAGMVAILALRRVTFVSLYLADGIVLPACSFLQGLLFWFLGAPAVRRDGGSDPACARRRARIHEMR